MSKNINQIFIANPITTNTSTDLMYFGQSPYGVGNDAAMTYSNFSAQFAGNVLTTKGDLYTFSTVNARLAVGSTNGQILQVNSGAATGLAWSIATYPTVATSTGSFIYANGTNFVASTSLWPNTVGASGKIVASNGTANVYSTATFPLVGGSAGNILISDGTNYIASTSLWPNTVGSAGKILRSDGTTNTYSTSTFADTYAVSTILYASSTNTVTGLATANSSTLVTNGSGVPAWQVMTAGQVLIGTTAGAPTAAAINSGTGILVQNASGSITVSLSGTGPGTLTWNDVAGTSQAAAVNNGYIISNASQTTVTIPATAAEGSVFAIQGKGAAGWILQMNTGQVIHLGSSASSSAGTLTSTNQWDSVTLVCVTANTTFAVTSVIGNLTVA